MENRKAIIDLILKAVALGMSVASIVLGFMNEADLDTQVTMLGIGLFALSVAALQKVELE